MKVKAHSSSELPLQSPLEELEQSRTVLTFFIKGILYSFGLVLEANTVIVLPELIRNQQTDWQNAIRNKTGMQECPKA